MFSLPSALSYLDMRNPKREIIDFSSMIWAGVFPVRKCIKVDGLSTEPFDHFLHPRNRFFFVVFCEPANPGEFIFSTLDVHPSPRGGCQRSLLVIVRCSLLSPRSVFQARKLIVSLQKSQVRYGFLTHLPDPEDVGIAT